MAAPVVTEPYFQGGVVFYFSAARSISCHMYPFDVPLFLARFLIRASALVSLAR